VLIGLEHSTINVVITDQIPMLWAKPGFGRCFPQYDGYQLFDGRLGYSHGHQVPFVSEHRGRELLPFHCKTSLKSPKECRLPTRNPHRLVRNPPVAVQHEGTAIRGAAPALSLVTKM
jgi:hypothetical protein